MCIYARNHGHVVIWDNMPEVVLTTKNTKVTKGKHVILLLSLRILHALRSYMGLTWAFRISVYGYLK